MRKLLNIVFLFSALYSQEQAILEWTNRYNGSGNDNDILSAMAIDLESNVYITGRSESLGGHDDYVTLKYSSNGVEHLDLLYNGINNLWDRATDLIIDNSGNIIVTGKSYIANNKVHLITLKYSPTGDLLVISEYGDSLGTYLGDPKLIQDTFGNIYLGFEEGSSGISIVKYTSDLNQEWETYFVTDSLFSLSLSDIAVDQLANVYLTASVANQFDEDYFLNDILTVQFNNQGIKQWVNYFTGSDHSEDTPVDIEIDNSNNVIVLGSTLYSSDDFVILKYSTNGDTLWQSSYDYPTYRTDIPTSLAIDSESNIVVTGFSFNDSEHSNYATIKTDSLGNIIWQTEYNGPGNNYDYARSLYLDSENNVYITGFSRPGLNDNGDCLTIKYNSTGQLMWSVMYTDTSSVSNYGKQIIVDENGDVYIAIQSIGNYSGADYLTVKYSQGTVGVSTENYSPNEFRLYQNFPNPFNPSTTIRYSILSPSHVQVIIYNQLGKPVRTLVNRKMERGEYKVKWDGKGNTGKVVSSGMYLYILSLDNKPIKTEKMIIVR